MIAKTLLTNHASSIEVIFIRWSQKIMQFFLQEAGFLITLYEIWYRY